jgi:hypothetical protein
LAKDEVTKRVALQDLSSSMGLYLKRKFWQHKFDELEAQKQKKIEHDEFLKKLVAFDMPIL